MKIKNLILLTLLCVLPFSKGQAGLFDNPEKTMDYSINASRLAICGLIGSVGLLALAGTTGLGQRFVLKAYLSRWQKELSLLSAKQQLTSKELQRQKDLAAKLNRFKKINAALTIAKRIEAIAGGVLFVGSGTLFIGSIIVFGIADEKKGTDRKNRMPSFKQKTNVSNPDNRPVAKIYKTWAGPVVQMIGNDGEYDNVGRKNERIIKKGNDIAKLFQPARCGEQLSKENLDKTFIIYKKNGELTVEEASQSHLEQPSITVFKTVAHSSYKHTDSMQTKPNDDLIPVQINSTHTTKSFKSETSLNNQRVQLEKLPSPLLYPAGIETIAGYMTECNDPNSQKKVIVEIDNKKHTFEFVVHEDPPREEQSPNCYFYLKEISEEQI